MIKELEDYNWFPKILRRFQMEYIGSIIKWADYYQPLVLITNKLLKENNINIIQDLCSGSGMPAVYMQEQIGDNYTTILSDKFPEPSFVNSTTVNYLQQETDVLHLLPQQEIMYTMYNAFHHFSDEDKVRLLQKFQQANAPFIIAEILQPDLLTLGKIFFTTTILQLIAVPFVQPFSLLRLLFTYIIPVNLFTITYDGMVSVFKSRSVKQYQQLIQSISNENYNIYVDRYSSWKGAVICIKGNPKK